MLTTFVHKQPRPSKVIDMKKYCTLSKLLRITVNLRRFITNTTNRKDKRVCTEKEISEEEIREAESIWVKHAQLTLPEDANFEKVR